MRGRLRCYIIALIGIVCTDEATGWVPQFRPTKISKKFVDPSLVKDRKRAICFDSEKAELWSPTSSISPEPSSSPQPSTQSAKQPKKQAKSFWVAHDALNQIKEQVDMISLLESYNLDKFRRMGSNQATALCPFHDDRNPSFSVNGARGFYKCFSCGAGGDVFNFVREYHKVKQKEEMSFMEAVRRVNAFILGGGVQGSSQSLIESPIQMISSEESKAMSERRERILAMNQEAAAFYSKCLTLPFAGGARFYLQSRGFESPKIARKFGLGYAPDVYFDYQYLPKEQQSLVRHLEERGFNASEILDSGLCVRKRNKHEEKGSKEGKQRGGLNTEHASSRAGNQTEAVEVDIASLMDRFRGRLIVPIFDLTGKKVLGFGGRILPAYNDDVEKQTNFKPPKYLNSPETAVFHKSHVLFGENMVREEMEYKSRQDKGASMNKRSLSTSNTDIIVVEGYMDVITLNYIGITTAVATMGTAISLAQVNAAAKLAAANGGRVVLCLDNDEAGYAAVERLCSGSFLRKASDSFAVQFCVATLTPGIKDPGDYIEFHLEQGEKASDVAQKFLAEVAEPAMDWSEWFLERIMGRYDANAASKASPGSFGDIFQRVSDFLSKFTNPADRTKSAYEVATKLAKLMAKESNSKDISNAARMQLESDLIDSASKIAKERELQKKRAEITSESSRMETATVQALTLSSPYEVGANEKEKLSSEALMTGGYASAGDFDIPGPRVDKGAPELRKQNFERRGRPRRRIYRPLQEKEEPSLTPHFAGFAFENQADADWLGIPRNKANAANSILTLGEMLSFEEPGFGARKLRPKPVYFFSNDYHGHHFVSSDAVIAGYSDKFQVTDLASVKEKGVSILVQEDVDENLKAAEESLLRNLVLHYPDSVIAVKDVLQASTQVGPDVTLKWSSNDREWLFNCLVEEDMLEKFAASNWDSGALRSVLLGRGDAPTGAFCENWTPGGNNETTRLLNSNLLGDPHTDPTVGNSLLVRFEGSLDSLFVDFLGSPETIFNGSYDPVTRAEKATLQAQEHLMTLLSAGASREVQILQEELNRVSSMLQPGESALESLKGSNNSASALSSEFVNKTSIPSRGDGPSSLASTASTENEQPMKDASKQNEIELYHKNLLGRYQQAVERRLQLARSAKRITERLMRFSSSKFNDAVEGRISIPLQRRLAKQVDDILTEIDERVMNGDGYSDDRLGKRDSYLLIEDELAEIERGWGDWCEDDFIWSLEKSNRNGGAVSSTIDLDDLEDDLEIDSLEETLARMDDEWRNWIE